MQLHFKINKKKTNLSKDEENNENDNTNKNEEL